MMDQVSRHAVGLGLPPFVTRMRDSERLRLATLVRLRWLSVAGQTAACVFVAWGMWWEYPVFACLALVAVSAMLNLFLTARYPATRRLSRSATGAVLAFDIVQLAGLLALTGGIQNPFAVFLVVPAIIASATQPPLTTVALGVLVTVAVTVVAFFHAPLPWPDPAFLALPPAYLAGMWFALASTLVFATVFVYRVAAESRALADALSATELVLQREQHLSALDGLAAAAAHELGSPLGTIAVIAKEMGREFPHDDPRREDVDLLIAQSERCRQILGQLTSLSTSSEIHMARHSLTAMVEEVVAPHRNFGIDLRSARARTEGREPVTRRNPGILYGLGNVVENAVDFAESAVAIETWWNESEVGLTVTDDGPGFAPATIARIGDPYISGSDAATRRASGNLGLGLFITKTLIERSGGTIAFANRSDGRSGAEIAIVWPRAVFEEARSPMGL